MLNLFTNPRPVAGASAESPRAAPSRVVEAIRDGSERSGADFDYLLRTATRESSLDPAAKAPTSTATGLFQFIEQTWLGTLKDAGPKFGLSGYSGEISEVRPGVYDVPDPAHKAEILALRSDPEIATMMAGELTRDNHQQLASRVGYPPSEADLYLAHVFGVDSAALLIEKSTTAPDTDASALFPDAARANQALFYDRETGRPLGVAAVRQKITDLFSRQIGAVGELAQGGLEESETALDPRLQVSAIPLLANASSVPALYGLFRTEGSLAPYNAVVRDLWSMPDPDRQSVSGAGDSSLVRAGTSEPDLGPPAVFTNVPLPPVRLSPDAKSRT